VIQESYRQKEENRNDKRMQLFDKLFGHALLPLVISIRFMHHENNRSSCVSFHHKKKAGEQFTCLFFDR
jgi:hypothetical protein